MLDDSMLKKVYSNGVTTLSISGATIQHLFNKEIIDKIRQFHTIIFCIRGNDLKDLVGREKLTPKQVSMLHNFFAISIESMGKKFTSQQFWNVETESWGWTDKTLGCLMQNWWTLIENISTSHIMYIRSNFFAQTIYI